jgi:hypothetical protein
MAGSETRRDRAKYLSLKEHLAEFAENNRRLRRGWCPVIDWVKRQPDDSLDDVIAAELYIQSHPEWGPSYCCDVIRDTWRFNAPEDVADIQHDHALALTRHPWATTRKPLEALFAHPEIQWRSPEAIALLIDYFDQHHPNPKAFFLQHHVRALLPADVAVSRLCSPDFSHLDEEPLIGGAPAIAARGDSDALV